MRRLKTVLAVTALTVSGLVIAPAAAQADDARCPSGHFCLFEYTSFGGGRMVFGRDNADLANAYYNNHHSGNDSASSMINNTNYNISLCLDSSFRNCTYSATRHTLDTTFENNGQTNEHVSSVDFIGLP